MNERPKKLWLEALRSGEYAQSFGRLRPMETEEHREGFSREPEVNAREHELYSVWREMVEKACVCKRWDENFWAFAHDVGRRPSEEHRLVRVDRTRDYKPGNVTWWYEAERDFR